MSLYFIKDTKKKHISDYKFKMGIFIKLKDYSNILFCIYDISFNIKNNHKLYTINSSFHLVKNLNYIYFILSKIFNNDISINIIHHYVTNSNNKIIFNLNKLFHCKEKLKSIYKFDTNTLLYNLSYHKHITSKNNSENHVSSYNMNYNLIRDIYNTKISHNFKKLLNSKKNDINIYNIFKIQDNIIDFILI